ncbi:MAG: DUF429 domain-containing protein [Acidobacteria bacterium]|nr:DUF429 domain-containing protein [Acidobacteriota bacterium]
MAGRHSAGAAVRRAHPGRRDHRGVERGHARPDAVRVSGRSSRTSRHAHRYTEERNMKSENYPRLAYGLDLAGYSQGEKSALVRAEWPGEGPVKAEVLTGHPFADELSGTDELDTGREQQAIDRLLAAGRLCADVPIDLQGLMGLDSAERAGHLYPPSIWQLTSRPVDYAFRALPPLADRIGAPVVRFRNILTKSQRFQLGSRLWETYPAATLQRLGYCGECRNSNGKLTYNNGRAKRENARWVPSRPGTRHQARDKAVACIAKRIGITAGDKATITDDVLDAVLCALTGVAPRGSVLNGSALDEEIRRCLGERSESKDKSRATHTGVTGPKGYVLLSRQFWGQIDLVQAEWKAPDNQE